MSFVNDTFTDANGTLLTAHTGELGATWAQNTIGGSQPLTINSNSVGIGAQSTTFSVTYASGSPASADYSATVDITGATDSSVAGLVIRASTTSQSWYSFTAGFSGFVIFRSSTNPVGPTIAPSGGMDSGTTYRLTLTGSGTTIIGRVQRLSDNQYLASNGAWQSGATDCITQTDSNVTAAGKAGLYTDESSHGLVVFDNFHADNPATGSFTASPSTVPSNHLGNIALTLVGSGTLWSSNTFTVSGVSGTAKVSQSITDTTHATLTITTGVGTGILTISDGSTSTTITVATPSLGISPSSGTTSTSPTLTLTGTNTLWSSETAAGLFSVTGGTGASIATPTITTDTAGTAVLTVGSSAGTLTVTDNSTGATASFTAGATPATIAITDANLYFSPYNWFSDGAGSMQANNIKGLSTFAWANMRGAYLKFKATVSSSGYIKLNLNTTTLQTLNSNGCPTIAWSIDGGAVQTSLLAYSASPVQVSLGSSLSAGTHSVFLWFRSVYITQEGDYYSTPLNRVQITGIELPAGGTTSAPPIKSRKMVVFGDSITEGDINVSGTRGVASQDANQTYGWYISDALDAEVGIVGFYGKTWAWFDSTWDHYSSTNSRLVGGLLTPTPNYIVINYGQNDGDPGPASSTVATTLAAISSAAPSSNMILTIPFSGVARTNLNAATLPSNCRRVDLAQPEMATGNLIWSFDGVHPTTQGHANLGTLMANAINQVTVAPRPFTYAF